MCDKFYIDHQIINIRKVRYGFTIKLLMVITTCICNVIILMLYFIQYTSINWARGKDICIYVSFLKFAKNTDVRLLCLL